jgi:chemotaxis protein histidine kinase CheA
VTVTSIEKANGRAVASHAEPGFDAVALAEADAIRTRAKADAEAKRIAAEAAADAEKIKAAEEAEKQRIANERAAMRLEKERADHQAQLAKRAAETAKALAEKNKAEQAAADEAAQEAQQLAEQERTERYWKWGARGIYAVGLIIAAPIQFLHFWDPQRPFLIAAPALLEGLALVLAFGAAWAVAHRRDVAPYRIGIMLSAMIAAGINLYGGMTDPKIGLNAGIIGAIASLGGPIVLMAYEHGIAQKADGIPSWRERRAVERQAKAEAAAKEKVRAEKAAADKKAADEKAAAQARSDEEQRRKDADRREHHPEVWAVADALRSARGSAFVTEQIWGEAWLLVTGCKTVGITLDIEARGRAQQARVKAATDVPIIGDFSLVESHRPARAKKDPDAPDGRRNNGGTPPRRTPGDSAPNSPLARNQARIERTADTAQKKGKK